MKNLLLSAAIGDICGVPQRITMQLIYIIQRIHIAMIPCVPLLVRRLCFTIWIWQSVCTLAVVRSGEEAMAVVLPVG